MYFFDLIDIRCNEGSPSDPMPGVFLSEETTHIMQFTGLLDKNGVEIYEGDIIQCEQLICLVRWDGFEAAFNFVSDGRAIIVTSKSSIDHWEVIGNIYENPHLLTPRTE